MRFIDALLRRMSDAEIAEANRALDAEIARRGGDGDYAAIELLAMDEKEPVRTDEDIETTDEVLHPRNWTSTQIVLLEPLLFEELQRRRHFLS